MRIQKTFMEQIKDSSTPLTSSGPSLGILRSGEGQRGLEEGNCCFLLAHRKGRWEESHRERSWAQTPRFLLPPFFLDPSVTDWQSFGIAAVLVPEGS